MKEKNEKWGKSFWFKEDSPSFIRRIRRWISATAPCLTASAGRAFFLLGKKGEFGLSVADIPVKGWLPVNICFYPNGVIYPSQGQSFWNIRQTNSRPEVANLG